MEIFAPKVESLNRHRSRKNELVFVGISVLIHVIAIGIMMRPTPNPIPSHSKPEERAIKARIIYPTLPQQAALEPLPVEEEPTLADTKPMVSDEPPEQISAPTERLADTEQDRRQQEQQTLKPEVSGNSASSQRVSSGRAIKRFMQQQNNQAIESLSRQQSATYARQLNSPDLNLPEYVAPQDQQLIKPKIVACDKTAVKVFKTLSQIMGGNLRCLEQPNIDEFIQKRLEKR